MLVSNDAASPPGVLAPPAPTRVRVRASRRVTAGGVGAVFSPSIGAESTAPANRVSPRASTSAVRQPPIEWPTASQGFGSRVSNAAIRAA